MQCCWDNLISYRHCHRRFHCGRRRRRQHHYKYVTIMHDCSLIIEVLYQQTLQVPGNDVLNFILFCTQYSDIGF